MKGQREKAQRHRGTKAQRHKAKRLPLLLLGNESFDYFIAFGRPLDLCASVPLSLCPYLNYLRPMQDQLQDELSESSEELYQRLHIVVDKGQDPIRIDKFLVARIQHASRTKVQKAIDAGMVTING